MELERAIIAIPTPNQPTCVTPKRKETGRTFFLPKEYFCKQMCLINPVPETDESKKNLW